MIKSLIWNSYRQTIFYTLKIVYVRKSFSVIDRASSCNLSSPLQIINETNMYRLIYAYLKRNRTIEITQFKIQDSCYLMIVLIICYSSYTLTTTTLSFSNFTNRFKTTNIIKIDFTILIICLMQFIKTIKLLTNNYFYSFKIPNWWCACSTIGIVMILIIDWLSSIITF